MTQMQVRIGRVTTARNARIHLAIDGRTCGASRRGRIGYEVTRPDLADPANLCKRCFRPARVAVAEMTITTAHGPAAERIRRMLATVTEACKTPEQRAADADLIARITRTIELAAPVLALPLAERPRTWADLRADYLRTHYQPAA